MSEVSRCDAKMQSNDVAQSKIDRLLLLTIRMGAFLCFAGWTWVHFYWEGPYGILLWHDATYELAGQLGLGWDEFVGTGANDGWIQLWIARIAWLYLVATILTLTVREQSWIQMLGLLLGSGMLVVLSYAKYAASQWQLPMFIEHGGQMLMPVLLVMALTFGVRHCVTVGTAIVAIISTFAGHGSYAIGLWPTPASFLGMISVILSVDHEVAQTILRIAGVLDMVLCVGIFFRPFRNMCLWYAVVWGGLTSLARPIAGMSWSLHYWGADQFLHEAILRAPHFMIPLYLVMLCRSSRIVQKKIESIQPNANSFDAMNSVLLLQNHSLR